MKITVEQKNGENIEKVINKPIVTLGRSSQCDVTISDDSLSRFHCQVEFKNENFYITDLGSSNGVFIDGRKIEINKEVKFLTYQEILIGQLKLFVADLEPLDSPAFTYEATSITGKKEIDALAKNKENIKASNKLSTTGHKSTKTNPLPYLLAILIIGGALYFQFWGDNTSENPVVAGNVPAGINIEDRFLSSKEYLDKEVLRICDIECQALGLTYKQGEGIVCETQQCFIFIQSSSHLNETRFEKISKQYDYEDLVAIYYALKSAPFESFQKKDIFQIHVILKDKDFKPYLVYRFHTKYFSKSGPEKARLMSELVSAFDTGNSAPFWNDANPIIKKEKIY